MINKTTLFSGVAAVVVVGGIVFAMSTAGAAPYDSYNEPSYHHTMHHAKHHMMHRARYESARYENSGRDDESTNRMMNEQTPPAFQVRLSSIDRPSDQMRHASVRDADGNTIGYVNGIITGQNGDIRALKIKVGGLWGYGGKLVTVGAEDFRYERDRNELTTDMPKKAFDQMQAEKS
jgi:hypothetical protein